MLAAGRSTRMSGRNKLLEDVRGVPMVRHAAVAAVSSGARPVIVVTGHEAAAVRAALEGLPLEIAHNTAYMAGLSASIRTGLGALPAETEGALVLLGDMPDIEAGHLARLMAAFAPESGCTIVTPVRGGRRGNPVLWGRDFFRLMMALDGDTGARRLIDANRDRVAEVELDTDAIFLDVDTSDALEEARRRPGG